MIYQIMSYPDDNLLGTIELGEEVEPYEVMRGLEEQGKINLSEWSEDNAEPCDDPDGIGWHIYNEQQELILCLRPNTGADNE